MDKKFVFKYENRELNITHVKKSRLKKVYFKILSFDNIQIHTNCSYALKDIKILLEQNSDKVFKKLNQFENSANIKEFYIFGQKVEELFFSNNSQKEIHSFYHFELKSIIFEYLNFYSNLMNVSFNTVSFRNQKSIWGSCSGKNRLSFNINLAQLPKELIEYIAVHELTHIKHKNHSKEFWSFVGMYLKDYKMLRKKLREFEKIVKFI